MTNSVIFAADAGGGLANAVLGVAQDARFEPSVEDTTRVEAVLAAELARHPRGTAIVPRLADYRRQYLGYLIEGRRMLYANYVCSEHASWRTELVVVRDGGACYFHVVLDLDRGVVAELVINGEA